MFSDVPASEPHGPSKSPVAKVEASLKISKNLRDKEAA